MKITYDVMREYDEGSIPFITTDDYDNAFETAYEYVYGMGGVTYIFEKHNGKTKKVTKFESDGWSGCDDVDVEVTIILQLA